MTEISGEGGGAYSRRNVSSRIAGEKTKKENEVSRSLEELEEDQPKKYVEAV